MRIVFIHDDGRSVYVVPEDGVMGNWLLIAAFLMSMIYRKDLPVRAIRREASW